MQLLFSSWLRSAENPEEAARRRKALERAIRSQQESVRCEIEAAQHAEWAAREQKVRALLEKWASGLTPALAIGPHGEVLGLCDADTPIGVKPFIFKG